MRETVWPHCSTVTAVGRQTIDALPCSTQMRDIDASERHPHTVVGSRMIILPCPPLASAMNDDNAASENEGNRSVLSWNSSDAASSDLGIVSGIGALLKVFPALGQ